MECYDTLAAGYDELHGEEQRIKLAIIKDYLHTNKDSLLLDVGCGTGLSAEFFNCKIIGIDNSREMIRKARERGNDDGDYILADAAYLPFRDSIFDSVICVTAIHNLKGPMDALKEIQRVGVKTGAVSILKKAGKYRQLVKMINDAVDVTTAIDEQKDRIIIFRIHGGP